MTPERDALQLIQDHEVAAVAAYITKARQYERFAKFFEQLMLNDMTLEYSDHVDAMLNDPKYDKTYLCVLLERAISPIPQQPDLHYINKTARGEA